MALSRWAKAHGKKEPAPPYVPKTSPEPAQENEREHETDEQSVSDESTPMYLGGPATLSTPAEDESDAELAEWSKDMTRRLSGAFSSFTKSK